MTVAEQELVAQLMAELLNQVWAAQDKAKAWRLIAESLMGVVHKD